MHPHTSLRRPDYSEPRPWQKLADAEWDELLPFVLVGEGPGRPLRDARARVDGVFWAAASGRPWHSLPSASRRR
jgi:transposase